MFIEKCITKYCFITFNMRLIVNIDNISISLDFRKKDTQTYKNTSLTKTRLINCGHDNGP